ncbi:putative non-specific serine/threonine protein kinase [Lupinus albus]|uniref:Putative non-specific serine/threonine protein kinase n=1 Tax=Lupinus albus TaxID=3870 RepID=A0A6A4Q0U0_LUPAL|nr:putative non-specific serine/threonine protein kinase [Lupinus albus]
MSPSIFLLWLITISSLAFPNLVNSSPLGYFIDCGGTNEVKVENILYTPDVNYINVGNTTTINEPNILPTLTTLRYFPDASAKKYCYSLPVIKSSKYIVKTIYYYGGFDGGKQPPVFDQIIEGTRWSIVNTTEDYAKGLSSYYEVVVKSFGKTLSVCLARNADTGSSSPFISALEVKSLDDSLYNPIDFTKYALVTVARHTFGGEHIISYPDDKFDRMWQPFKDQNPAVGSHSNVTSSDFWNLPPAIAFTNGITTSRGKTLEIQWPPVSLPNTYYYISLYFQDNRSPSPYSWRVFNVSINDHTFFADLNASAKGVTVYSSQWPLSGLTKLTMTPAVGEPVGPVINAGEIFQILPISGRTQTKDVIAMMDLARSIQNPPYDWNGDPCLPKGNSWTGVSCSQHDLISRVTTLNLTNVGLDGSLPATIGNLTSLVHLWLGGNKISGTLPDMSGLHELQTLHLENNKLEGPIPSSLKKLPKLQEINLQNNNLQEEVPKH